MFDGKVQTSQRYGVKSRRQNSSQTRGNVIEQARKEREARALEKQKQQAAVRIQCLARKSLSNQKFHNMLRQEFDTSTGNINKMSILVKKVGKSFHVPSAVMIKLLRMFLTLSNSWRS